MLLRRSCVRRSKPAYPARSCASKSTSESGSASGPRPTGPAPRPNWSAAVLLAQPVVDRSDVQQHGPAIAECVGGRQQRVRGKSGNDKAVAPGERRCRPGDILAPPEPDLFQGEMLIEELARGVVVLDREP